MFRVWPARWRQVYASETPAAVLSLFASGASSPRIYFYFRSHLFSSWQREYTLPLSRKTNERYRTQKIIERKHFVSVKVKRQSNSPGCDVAFVCRTYFSFWLSVPMWCWNKFNWIDAKWIPDNEHLPEVFNSFLGRASTLYVRCWNVFWKAEHSLYNVLFATWTGRSLDEAFHQHVKILNTRKCTSIEEWALCWTDFKAELRLWGHRLPYVCFFVFF